jgi:hypothetical protein
MLGADSSANSLPSNLQENPPHITPTCIHTFHEIDRQGRMKMQFVRKYWCECEANQKFKKQGTKMNATDVRCVAGLLKNDCLSCSSAALRVDGSETNT